MRRPDARGKMRNRGFPRVFTGPYPGFITSSSMRIEISTPALLFPAISLLMLAYSNRFFTLASIIRNLHRTHTEAPNPIYPLQIKNLRFRMNLIRDMQSFGVLSLILCTACMGLLFKGYYRAGEAVFGVSIVCMLLSLIWSLVEIRISGKSLDLHLRDMEKQTV